MSLSLGAPPAAPGKWLVALSVAIGSLMATIDASIVNVAMPVIRGELGASLQEITWVSTAYMVAMVLVMPLTGFLGALIGQKNLYVVSLVVFLIGSLLCGTAGSLEALVLFRIVQGLGGGALQPTQQAILRQAFPPHEQGMAMALFAMVIMIGPAIGPVLGGWIVDDFSWPWIFYINLPIGVLGIFMAWRNVREPDDVRVANRARAASMRGNFDWAGIVLMAIGVGALQYLFEEGPGEDWFESRHIVIAGFTAAIGLSAFVIRELTAAAPVVNLRLFRDPTFASGTAIATVMFAMLMGSMFLLPVFMQEVLHFPATDAGLVLMPRTLAMMVAAPIIGRLYNRVPPALTVGFGVLLYLVGSWQLSQVTLDTSSRDLIAPLVISGVAFACLFVPLTTAALSNTPRHQLAEAAGLNSFLRQIGGSVGLTIFATMFTRYAAEATTSLSWQLSSLRPEVAEQLATIKAGLWARGVDPAAVPSLALRALHGKAATQGVVIGFEKAFLVQGLAFLAVLPLLCFLRVTRHPGPTHVELPTE